MLRGTGSLQELLGREVGRRRGAPKPVERGSPRTEPDEKRAGPLVGGSAPAQAPGTAICPVCLSTLSKDPQIIDAHIGAAWFEGWLQALQLQTALWSGRTTPLSGMEACSWPCARLVALGLWLPCPMSPPCQSQTAEKCLFKEAARRGHVQSSIKAFTTQVPARNKSGVGGARNPPRVPPGPALCTVLSSPPPQSGSQSLVACSFTCRIVGRAFQADRACDCGQVQRGCGLEGLMAPRMVPCMAGWHARPAVSPPLPPSPFASLPGPPHRRCAWSWRATTPETNTQRWCWIPARGRHWATSHARWRGTWGPCWLPSWWWWRGVSWRRQPPHAPPSPSSSR